MIDVLLVNYSTVGDFKNCLQSLREHEGDAPVYVFQNHFADGVTEACIEIAKEYGVNYFRKADRNLGHGAGINALAEVAQAEHLFIVNPDVVWIEPVLGELRDFLEMDPNRCVVGPRQIDSQGRFTAAGIFGTLEQPAHRSFRQKAGDDHKSIEECLMVAGSAFMIRRNDFYMYGGMLEGRHYFSETALQYTAKHAGRSNWYYGPLTMIHEWHTSTPQGHPGTDGMFAQDRELFRAYCDERGIPHD